MAKLLRGESCKVTANYRRKIVLADAPVWTLYDSSDEPVLTGVAVLADGVWQADVTIPDNLVMLEPNETLTVEFSGNDITGRQRIYQTNLEVIAQREVEPAYGLVWYSGETSLTDNLLLTRTPSKITTVLREGYGAGRVLATAVQTAPAAASDTGAGKLYEVTVAGLVQTRATSGGYYPYQLVSTITYPTGPTDTIIKPVYGVDPIIASRVNNLKRFLDKGRFTDIDPNLEWALDELIHYLIEGCNYINLAPPEMSYWTISDLPSPLESALGMAAAYYALSARYLAEGMDSFNFNSGGVNLDYDRTAVISAKMADLKTTLDQQLALSKRPALRTLGVGTPQAGVGPKRNAVGRLGISFGPTTNVGLRPYGLGRRYR